jgi:predicted adenylyl cyclase CyaB
MEIEIRAFIHDITNFEEKLKELGAVFKSESHIIDYWFCEEDKNNFEEVKQDKPGSYGLRIRKHIRGSDTNIELNCKVLEKSMDHNAFHEYETKIEDFDQTKKILEKIGFKVFCILDKKRTTYKIADCSINIENIKGFRPAVELEIISDSNQEGHKKYLRELLNKLGIKEKDKIEKSITFLYMKEFSFK